MSVLVVFTCLSDIVSLDGKSLLKVRVFPIEGLVNVESHPLLDLHLLVQPSARFERPT